jgi:DNA polymerase-3 subunit alpha
MYLIFDTETTGLPQNYKAPLTDFNNWPRLVQLAWQLHGERGNLISQGSIIVQPNGFSIPYTSEKIHGISTERATKEGIPLNECLDQFEEALAQTQFVAGHNIEFDINIVGCEFLREGRTNVLEQMSSMDTKEFGTDFCAIPGGRGGKFKWPTLTELHEKLFHVKFEEAHDAAYDVDATGKCFFELIRIGVIPSANSVAKSDVIYEAPILQDSNFKSEKTDNQTPDETLSEVDINENQKFVHLHVHSQYSILQSTTTIDALIKKSLAMGSPAVAVTDAGNMMGAFHFVSAAHKKGIKPIVGAELNLCRNHTDRSSKDDGSPVVLLAKNFKGYQNLSKLSSLAYTEGFYYVPRISRDLLVQHKEGLILCTGSLWGEIPSTILNIGEEKAEELFVFWKEQFGEDFYAELNNHGLEEEQVVNRTLVRFCEKHNVKYFAANNSYYTEKSDAEAQDALICVKEGEKVSTPSKYIGKKGREFRFGFPNNEFYLKDAQEMAQAFSAYPGALETTIEIADKCDGYKLDREILLPKFDIEETFISNFQTEIIASHERLISQRNEKWVADGYDEERIAQEKEKLKTIAEQSAYLEHLTFKGATYRYGEFDESIRERLKFELSVIEKAGYPGYLLIVEDFCNEARKMDVSVGPGRGSAAGSAVAYCLRITDVDPIKYDLLFERFLNPDRISMPDMDIDFEDEGREKVIEYVRNKYSRNAVAQIITYGTMAAKSAVKDAARVFDLSIGESEQLTKLIPDRASLSDIFNKEEKQLKDDFSSEEFERMQRMRLIATSTTPEGKVLRMAKILEGSIRNTGTHACGVIITPTDITNFVPVATVKDSDMWCTQFDNSVVEKAGLLKMDFLGLKTLSIIKNAIKLIKLSHNIDIDIDNIPIDDEKTYELFQRGETVAIFQYESEGMRKHMRDLKPTVFADLIAMNALYRPGPMEYIPQFIRRKHGLEKIEYDLPEMEDNLKETYGITVYQEQVMLLSQRLANFTKGQADVLRKAMGKKLIEELNKMKSLFMEGAIANGHPADKLEKIWTDWEKFASYAFNKSHSTCYAWIAYQTAYLKAHYPAEFMAATLSNSMSDIKGVTFFMEECKRMRIPVLSPDVNESLSLFSVNKAGAIRFGLAAVKAVGENAVESMIRERESKPFETVFDFLERVDDKATNKRVLESLAMCGAFDRFGITRSAYFGTDNKGEGFIDTLVKYARAARDGKNSSQASLFGEGSGVQIQPPSIPRVEPWDALTELSKEKDLVGMFISGHPLDDFALEIEAFCYPNSMEALENPEPNNGREISFAGIVKNVQHRMSQQGNPYGSFTLENGEGSHDFRLFRKDYMSFKAYMQDNFFLYVRGRFQKRRYGQNTEEKTEFQIAEISLLAEVKEKLGRYLTIGIDSEFLTEKTIEKLDELLVKNTGHAQLRIELKNGEDRVVLPSSERNKILVTKEIQNELEAIPGVYSISLSSR